MTELVDVHAHFLPDFYVAAMQDAGHVVPDAMPGWPTWSVASHLELMDGAGIDRSVLSISSPGVHTGSEASTVDLARRVNDEAARLCGEHPDRFSFFACLPLPYLDSGLAEMARAVDDLGAVGIVLETNIDGTYLGEGHLDPVLAELDRRGTVLFVHPTAPPDAERIGLGMPLPLIEFWADTTRAVSQMMMSGTLTRYADIQVVVPHCGAFLPLEVDRLDMFAHALGVGAGTAGRPSEQLAALWFDLAGTPMPVHGPLLADRVGPGRLLYGSDHCFTPAAAVTAQVAALDDLWPAETYGPWRDLAAANAARLFGDPRSDPASTPVSRPQPTSLVRQDWTGTHV